MDRNFCFEENQVDKLVQLVKHELVDLDVLIHIERLSDSARLHLKDEYALVNSILDVLFVEDVLSNFEPKQI